jgi:hypothetical protein
MAAGANPGSPRAGLHLNGRRLQPPFSEDVTTTVHDHYFLATLLGLRSSKCCSDGKSAGGNGRCTPPLAL